MSKLPLSNGDNGFEPLKIDLPLMKAQLEPLKIDLPLMKAQLEPLPPMGFEPLPAQKCSPIYARAKRLC